MRTVAVLPVKRLGAAKRRLEPVLAPPGRAELAEAMLEDVLEALVRVNGLDGVLVVSGAEHARRLGRRHGAAILDDPDDAGHPQAAALGVARALADGVARVLLVPGDCPALDPAEVESLLALPHEVAVVSDRHGEGTNALLLRPPDAIPASFGPGSLRRHLQLAEAAGREATVAHIPSLELDVDTPGDLDALRTALADRAGAERTRALLARLAGAA